MYVQTFAVLQSYRGALWLCARAGQTKRQVVEREETADANLGKSLNHNAHYIILWQTFKH